jgi:membrane protease YdiL (CAAX protease family)
MARWPKALGRWLLLGVVCAAVYASLSIPGALRQRIIAAANTTTIVFAITADTWSRDDLTPKAGSLAGHQFTGQCFERNAAIERALYSHAQPPDPQRLVCRIDTGLGAEEGRAQTGAMIEAMKFSPRWTLKTYGWYDGLWGHRGLAENLLALFEAGLWVLVFCFLFDIRQDWANARNLLATKPRWIYLPIAAKMVGLLLGDAVDRIFLVIDKTSAFIGTVIHAPISEEILFRALYFTLIARLSNIWFAGLYVSAIFALDHGYSVAGTLGTFCSALALQYLYVRFNSIIVCVLAHVLINGTGFLVNAFTAGF